jgi:RimJ/RimL family protein N-acetyltransferase
MTQPPQLRSERLLLRGWRESDREPFARINADTEVARFLPQTLARGESDQLIASLQSHLERHGFGLWAVSRADADDQLIGFVGLNVVSFNAHFTPAVEIGWRLQRSAWGCGYATEAAREALRYGFERAGLAEIVALTVPANRRSRAVMGRLGMTHSEHDDFDHPRVAPGSDLRRHVLYRLTATRFRSKRTGSATG